jgi:hypothetical protein
MLLETILWHLMATAIMRTAPDYKGVIVGRRYQATGT